MLLFLKSNEKHRIRSSLIFWTLFDQAKSVIEKQKILNMAKYCVALKLRNPLKSPRISHGGASEP
jgi:hypothetical protein